VLRFGGYPDVSKFDASMWPHRVTGAHDLEKKQNGTVLDPTFVTSDGDEQHVRDMNTAYLVLVGSRAGGETAPAALDALFLWPVENGVLPMWCSSKQTSFLKRAQSRFTACSKKDLLELLCKINETCDTDHYTREALKHLTAQWPQLLPPAALLLTNKTFPHHKLAAVPDNFPNVPLFVVHADNLKEVAGPAHVLLEAQAQDPVTFRRWILVFWFAARIIVGDIQVLRQFENNFFSRGQWSLRVKIVGTVTHFVYGLARKEEKKMVQYLFSGQARKDSSGKKSNIMKVLAKVPEEHEQSSGKK
jgi:hypothetical protein